MHALSLQRALFRVSLDPFIFPRKPKRSQRCIVHRTTALHSDCKALNLIRAKKYFLDVP